MSIRSLKRLLVFGNLLLVCGLVATGAWVGLARPPRAKKWQAPAFAGDAKANQLAPYKHYRLLASMRLRPQQKRVVHKAPPPVDPNLAFLRTNIRVKRIMGKESPWLLCDVNSSRGRETDTLWFIGKVKRIGGRPVKLLKVDSQAGIFELQGKRYRLSPSGVQAVGGGTGMRGNGGERPTRVPTADDTGKQPQGRRYATTQRINADRWLISGSEQDRVFNNLSSYLNEVGIVPHTEGGRTIGLRVTTIRPETYAYKRGFRKGDVITQVNTYELQSLQQIHVLKNKLRSATALRIHYIRNAREYRKVFKLRR